jgi:hypothetical protein
MTKISKPAIRGKNPFFVTDKARWQALVDKDERADGQFWFSVKNHRRLLPPFLSCTPA